MTDIRVTPEGYCWKCMGRKVPTYELADGYDCNVITSDIHICRNCLVKMVEAIDRVVQPNAIIGTPEMIPPDGEYEGVWSGYTVRFDFPSGSMTFGTTDGVRGSRNVVVTVKGGEVEFE